MTGFLIGAATALALVLFVRRLMALVGAGHWRDGATMTFILMAVLTSAVDILITFAGQWKTSVDAFHNAIVIAPGWSYDVQLATYLLMILGCAGIVLARAARRSARLHLPALIMFCLVLVSDGSAILHGDDPFRHVFYIAVLAILAVTVVAPRGPGIIMGVATFATVTALSSGAAVFLNRGFAEYSCGDQKCGVLNFAFRGIFDNENALALYLALAMPFVFLAFGRWTGTVLCAYLVFLVLLTGSRSGDFAAIVTYVVLLTVRPDRRSTAAAHWRLAVVYSALSVLVVLGIALPWNSNNPASYTGRAHLWIIARGMVGRGLNWLDGTGAYGWDHVRQAGLIDFSAVYSVHNEWLQVLFSTGVIGGVLFITALVMLVVEAGREHGLLLGCVLLPVACLAITERPWSIDVVDWMTWAMPAALLCYPARRRALASDRTADGVARNQVIAANRPTPASALVPAKRRRMSVARSGS